MNMISNNLTSSSANKRDYRIDAVRLFACIAVITSHFFIHTEFKTSRYEGFSMWIQAVVCSLQVGSNLYMILTGYLNCRRPFSLTGYRGWHRVIVSYIIMSIIMIIVSREILGYDISWKGGIIGIFSYTTIPYAWYVEMWIGLFIISPLLNVLYCSIGNKRNKLYMILMIYAMTAPADFLNRYGLYIFPQYWVFLYPVGLYFTGCYIREYKPSISLIKLMCFILMICVLSPTLNLFIPHYTYLYLLGSRGGLFLQPLAVAVFIFVFFVSDKWLGCLNTAISCVAKRSFDIFLASAVIDGVVYPYFMSNIFVTQSQAGLYIPVIVALVFLLSFALALFKQLIVSFFQWIIHKMLFLYKVVFNIADEINS